MEIVEDHRDQRRTVREIISQWVEERKARAKNWLLTKKCIHQRKAHLFFNFSFFTFWKIYFFTNTQFDVGYIYPLTFSLCLRCLDGKNVEKKTRKIDGNLCLYLF